MDIEAIQRVFVIFKTHLDIGFTDLARNVVARYFHEFIPAAIDVARRVRERSDDKRFVWTTGSWLVYEYLEQASADARRLAERAIENGDIAWHGLPFTTHTELMNTALFRHGLSLCARLDQRFGRQTIAAKMTDVPGHTRAIVCLLAEAGIEFLHIGVNPASTAPDVPSLFRWQHPDGSALQVMYDRGDYGQTTTIPEANVAVVFAHTRDNQAPQTEAEVWELFGKVQGDFPHAEIVGATLCDVARALENHPLPLVTEEIGDSWIHGAASDPLRMTPYRAAIRLYQRWVDSEDQDPLQPALDQFARYLLLVPEHTWGLLVESLEDETSYEGAAFVRLRLTEAAAKVEDSWEEQRSAVITAIQALAGEPRARAEEAVKNSDASAWESDRFKPTEAQEWRLDHFDVAIDETGALCRLESRRSGRQWAQVDATLGRFVYESFSASDYDRFVDEYVTLDADWAKRAFSKALPADVSSTSWLPRVVRIFVAEDTDAVEVLAELSLPEPAIVRFGAPARLQVKWVFPRAQPGVDFAVQWFDKRATRLPTAAWVTFAPLVESDGTWEIHKLGDWIRPGQVVPQGGRLLHGVDTGVRYSDPRDTLMIESLDAPVVSPGCRSLLRFHAEPQLMNGGMHFCLWNNVWNTNFPYWHDRDERFRFRCAEGDSSQ